MAKVSRRRFLLSGAAIGGGFLVGWLVAPKEGSNLSVEPDEVAFNAFIKITEDNRIVVVTPQAEMGQGINTALAMLVAEEMDCDWNAIEFEEAPIDAIYANTTVAGLAMEPMPMPEPVKDFGLWALATVAKIANVQITGGSTSVRNFYEPMREAGAAARETLIRVAAQRWGVSPRECLALEGKVTHRPSSRSFAYGELAGQAATVSPPKNPPLKPRSQWRLLGKSIERKDLHDKVTGQGTFGIDVQLPSMLHATIKAAPAFGGRVLSADTTRAETMPGVERVIVGESTVAVVGDSFWRCKKALDAVDVSFSRPDGALDDKAIAEAFDAAIGREEGWVYEDKGNAREELAATQADKIIDVTYRVPYLAHATMEPQNTTAYVSEDACHVWAPTQVAGILRQRVAAFLNMEPEQVTIHTTYLGGGFGRRLEVDVALQAVALSQEVGKPVKLVWTREEDTAHDAYRPGAVSRWRATLQNDLLPRAIDVKSVSQSASGSFMDRNMPGMEAHQPDTTSVEGAAWSEYEVPHRRVEHVVKRWDIPVGFWRSVGNSHNAFFKESFIDEMAHSAGEDPVAYRLRMLSGAPRYRTVLETTVSEAGPAPTGEGTGRGYALHMSFNTIVGQAVDISMVDGRLSVDRVTAVVDCGDVVNPDTVRAQIEGGIIFGLTAALYGEINFANGAVEQSNFHDYQMLTLADAPAIKTHIIVSGAEIGGIGEPGTPPIAPALTNAIFNATGQRIRELPIMRHLTV